VTDDSGSFAKHALTIPAGALPGMHWVTAIGRKSGDAAQATFNERTNWTEFGFAPRAKRENPFENVLNTGTVSGLDVAWTQSTGGAAIFASPIVVGGGVYVASEDGKLRIYNATTGAVVRTIVAGGLIATTPTVVGGTVYFGGGDGKVYA